MKDKPLNLRQEKFCLALASPDMEGRVVSRADAYLSAYDRCSSREQAISSAYKLMQDPRIRRRLSELTQKIYDDWVEVHLPFSELVERIRARVDDDKRPATQVAAIKLALQVRKDFVDRYVVDEDLRKLSDEELLKRATKALYG